MGVLDALDTYDEVVNFGKLLVAAPFMAIAMGTAITGAIIADAAWMTLEAAHDMKERIDVVVDKLDDKAHDWITRKNKEKENNTRSSIEDNTALLHTTSAFDTELDKLEQASFAKIGLRS